MVTNLKFLELFQRSSFALSSQLQFRARAAWPWQALEWRSEFSYPLSEFFFLSLLWAWQTHHTVVQNRIPDTIGLCTLDVRAQVPGFQHTMALCPHLGYPILIAAPFCPARRHLKQVKLCSKYKALDSPRKWRKRCAHRYPVPSLAPNHNVVTLHKGTAPAPSNVGCCSQLENGCVYISAQRAPYSGHLARAIRKENGGSRGLGNLKTDFKLSKALGFTGI